MLQNCHLQNKLTLRKCPGELRPTKFNLSVVIRTHWDVLDAIEWPFCSLGVPVPLKTLAQPFYQGGIVEALGTLVGLYMAMTWGCKISQGRQFKSNTATIS